MRFRFGLRSELVTNISLLVLAMVFLFLLVVLRLIEWVVLEEKARSADLIVRMLQRGMEERIGGVAPLFGADLATDEGTLEALRNRPDLYEALEALRTANALDDLFLVNPNFQIVLAPDPGRIGEHWKDRDIVDALYLEKILKRYRQRHFLSIFLLRLEPMTVTAPLSLEGRIVGTMRFTLPMRAAQNVIQKAQLFVFLYLSLDALLVIFFGSLLFIRSFVRPLSDLIDVAERVTEGDLTARVHLSGTNEITRLAGMLNVIVEAIEALEDELMHHQDHLENVSQELEAAQALAIHVEKMATIGQLAAGVAHEVGNPLGAIFGYLDMLKSGTESEAEREEIVSCLEEETARIDRIVRDLLNYSRPTDATVVLEDVNAVVTETISFLKGQKRLRRLTFEVDLDQNLPRLPLDSQKLRQVMINLILNAADAMRDEGILRIVSRLDTWRADYDDRQRGLLLQREHRWPRRKREKNRIVRGFSQEIRPGRRIVSISVIDSGCGIEAPRLQHIFDPFYTTKAAGKGTGLGLAIVLQIVESFGGKVAVESAPRRGTSVTIHLPTQEKNG